MEVTVPWSRMPNYASLDSMVVCPTDSSIVSSTIGGVFPEGRTVSVVAYHDTYADGESNRYRFDPVVNSHVSFVGSLANSKIIGNRVEENLIGKVDGVMVS